MIMLDLDKTTKKSIDKRIKHIIDMAKANKSIEDIIKFNDLGINKEDIKIMEVLNRWNTYYNNQNFENELRSVIETQFSKQRNNEEQNKIRM